MKQRKNKILSAMVRKTEKPQKPAFQMALLLFDMGGVQKGKGHKLLAQWDLGMAVGVIP